MILKHDEERHDYIVEDLDDEIHLVIKESQLERYLCIPSLLSDYHSHIEQDLDEKIMQLNESESE
jgi:TFIIH basal transcription factor complex TTD-A subunit